MPGKFWWLKERYNPQLGTYYVKCGRISIAYAKAIGKALYGENTMHKFESEEEYLAEIDRLKKSGEKIQ